MTLLAFRPILPPYLFSSIMKPPDSIDFTSPLRVPESSPEIFSSILNSLVIVSQTSEAFHEILDTCDDLAQRPDHAYHAELSWHAGPRPFMISSQLVALETLTYFGICRREIVTPDESIYTLTDPHGMDFLSYLATMMTSIRDVAQHRGVDPKTYLHHLVRSHALTHPPMEKCYLRYMYRDLRAVLQLVRAELTFYLIDERDPETVN